MSQNNEQQLTKDNVEQRTTVVPQKRKVSDDKREQQMENGKPISKQFLWANNVKNVLGKCQRTVKICVATRLFALVMDIGQKILVLNSSNIRQTISIIQ